ncbi:MAG: hypothetical protein ABIM89_18180 [Mycobacteriales bacterium]
MKLFRTHLFRVCTALFTAVALLPGAPASAAPPPAPRRFAMPMRAISAPAEPYGQFQAQSICTNGPTPAVLAFQKLVMARYPGSRDLGITRGCRSGGRSEHKEGRAWDWGVRVDRPREKAYGDDLVGWLLAADAQGVRAANARRLGIMYIIWNRKIWTASQAGIGWRPYFGPNPHTDHVHFSWTWPGAQKLTSYWTGTPYGIGTAGGVLDPLWGGGGWLPADPTDSLRLVDSLRWSDGRMWLVSQSSGTGDVVIEERLPTGELGSAFGGSGRTRVTPPADTLISSATLTAAGMVVLAGSTLPPPEAVAVPTRNLFAMRVLTSGTPDPAFGMGGYTWWDLGGDEGAAAVAMTGDDILLAGNSIVSGISTMVVVRLTPAGLPAEFGTAGAFVAPAGSVVAGGSILVNADGSIHVGCATSSATCVAKLTPGGSFDQTWAGGGVTGMGGVPGTVVLARGPAGTLYATFLQTNGFAGIYRLNSMGVGDPTFGSGADWLQSYGTAGCTNRPTAMTVRSDGSPVIAGLLEGCGKGFVARLSIDGPHDPTWGNAGVATFTDVAGLPVAAVPHVALQADGHVVVAALGGGTSGYVTSVGRFTTSGPVQARTVAVTSATKIAYGAPVKINAVVRFTNTFRLADGVPVTFESRADGAVDWAPVGPATSTVGGVATLTVTAGAHASYRVVSGETTSLFGATSSPVGFRVNYALTPKIVGPVAPAKLFARQGVTLSITAAPARPGRRIWLQRYDKNKWRTVATPALDAQSSASVRFASQTPATVRFRWVIFGDAALDGFTTPTQSVLWNARPVPAKPKPPVPAPTATTPPPAPPNAPGPTGTATPAPPASSPPVPDPTVPPPNG